MRGKDDRGAIGYLVELIDEYRTELAQPFDHVDVVHHLVAHVDRRTEQVDGAFHDVDGAIDAGAEPAGVGEQDLHASFLRRPSRMASRITSAAPTLMAASATLNAGKYAEPQCACTKSTT